MLHNISIIDGRGVYKVTQVTSLCHLHSLCKFHNIKSYIKLFPMAITPKTSAKGHISHYILSFFPNNLFLYLFLFCLLYAHFFIFRAFYTVLRIRIHVFTSNPNPYFEKTRIAILFLPQIYIYIYIFDNFIRSDRDLVFRFGPE